VWLHAFLGNARSEAALVERIGVDSGVVARAVELLLRDHQLSRLNDGSLKAVDLVIPVGATEGWEAAVLDHHRAMSASIAAKAVAGRPSAADDEVGGATLTFSLYPGHPHEARVRALLTNVRAQVNALWQEVTAHAVDHPPSDDDLKVTFYFGQMVSTPDPEPSTPNAQGAF
jgi:hypothetical protein